MILDYVLHGSHEETEQSMSALAEGHLHGLKRWRVLRHLAACEGCRTLYESFLAVLESARRLGRDEPAPRPELADRVVERIRRPDETS